MTEAPVSLTREQCAALGALAYAGLDVWESRGYGPLPKDAARLVRAIRRAGGSARNRKVGETAGQASESKALREDSASLLTVGEVADMTGLSSRAIRKRCEAGHYRGADRDRHGHWQIPSSTPLTRSGDRHASIAG